MWIWILELPFLNLGTLFLMNICFNIMSLYDLIFLNVKMFSFMNVFNDWNSIFSFNSFLPWVFDPKTWTLKVIEWHKIQRKTYFISIDTCSSSCLVWKKTQQIDFWFHDVMCMKTMKTNNEKINLSKFKFKHVT